MESHATSGVEYWLKRKGISPGTVEERGGCEGNNAPGLAGQEARGGRRFQLFQGRGGIVTKKNKKMEVGKSRLRKRSPKIAGLLFNMFDGDDRSFIGGSMARISLLGVWVPQPLPSNHPQP